MFGGNDQKVLKILRYSTLLSQSRRVAYAPVHTQTVVTANDRVPGPKNLLRTVDGRVGTKVSKCSHLSVLS